MAVATMQVAGRLGCTLHETTAVANCRHGGLMEASSWGDAAKEARPPTAGNFPHFCSTSAVRLTVWCKSLLFNGNGYTVYDDSDGRMVFRVDNYSHNWREEAHLMDSAGNVLLTVRRCRKKLSITESWEVYQGDRDVSSRPGGQPQRPLFRVTKTLGNSSCTVSLVSSQQQDVAGVPAYRLSWSRQHEWFRVFAGPSGTSPVAEVSRKFCGGARGELLGKDVLSMRVQPGMNQALVMALVMINDAMK